MGTTTPTPEDLARISSALHSHVVAIDSLVLDPANVRKHPVKNVEAIKGSLARFGQQKPIVCDRKGIVRAGNGTLVSARELGWKFIARVESDLTDAELTAFAIADNRTAELAEWDMEALSKTLADFAGTDFDMAAIGFDANELASMGAMIDSASLETAGDDGGNAEQFRHRLVLLIPATIVFDRVRDDVRAWLAQAYPMVEISGD